MEGLRFVQAGCLQEGYELKCLDVSKEAITGIRIKRLEEAIAVYNFEATDYHIYFIGGNVLVHNKYANPSGNRTNDQSKSSVVFALVYQKDFQMK